MADKVVWMGYVDVAVSELANKIRKHKGWSKSRMIEMALRALIAQAKDAGELQSAGFSAADLEMEPPFERCTTATGRPAIRPKEEFII